MRPTHATRAEADFSAQRMGTHAEDLEPLRIELEAMRGKRPAWRRRMEAADQIVSRLLSTQGAAITRARRGSSATRAVAVA